MNNADMPAMPLNNKDYDGNWNKDPFIGHGLTKREYFAGLIMKGLSTDIQRSCSPSHMPVLVDNAIRIADELLKQLEEK